MADYKELQKIASQVRRDIVRMVHGAKNGHPGGALGCTDLLVLLYFKYMVQAYYIKCFHIRAAKANTYRERW